MQRPRHRKSRTASSTEGISQAQKQKGASRSFADSWSYADGIICNDMSEQNSSSFPVRKLRADKFSVEVEPKRRSPSVIARLIGLETLPSPIHVQTRQERVIESYQFKDVYEDLDAAARIANRCCSSKGHANTILIEPESAHVGDKLKESKHLFADENFQYAKGLNVSSNLLDTDEDLSVQYLKQMDNMFMKHMHAPEVYRSSPPGSYIAILKPEKNQGKAKPWRLARDTSSRRHNFMSHMKRQDGLLLEPHNRHRVRVSRKSTRAPLEDTDEGNILSLPTRIVVLKPNLGKIQNDSTSKSVGSHFCPRRIRKMEESKSVGDAETLSRSKKDTCHKVGSSMLTSKESREIAREIARKIRNGSDATIKSIRFIGYAGDESSYDPDETDSESESKVITLSYIKPFDSELYRHSSSNKETKKRLPEKLKTAPKYRDLETFTKGTTLGEMLSLPDVDARYNHLRAKGLGETSNRLSDCKQNAVRGAPLGISSRDGWPNEAVRLSSRLRLHPHSIDGSSSNRRRTDQYEFCEERYLMNGNSSPCSISKLAREKSSQQENSASKISRSHGEKSRSCSHMLIDETWSSSDGGFKTQATANTKDILEDPRTFQPDSKSNICENHVPDERSGELGSSTVSLKMFLPKQLYSDVDGEDSAVQVQEDSAGKKEKHNHQASPSSRHLGPEPEPSPISKDNADHHSPNSVLEVPFVEDPTSSESFERVSAELHELRMQLQLLKMESGTFIDSSTQDEVDQTSPNASERNHTQEFASDNWETPYGLDFLISSGLEESDIDMFRTAWYSNDCPLDPELLFDELKKNYNDEVGSSRSERRLLFDRIKSHISEIFQNHVNLYPWVTPKLSGSSCLKLQNEAIRDAFQKLISQDILNREISLDIVLDREMQWRDMRGEINAIGNEISNLLVDDMISDVIYVSYISNIAYVQSDAVV